MSKSKRIAVWLAAAIAVSSVAAVGPASASPGASQKNIVQTAVAAGQFKTLVSLVKQAGLAGVLSGSRRLTVFAPTDAAFAKVPKATLNALARDKAKLKSVLLYHVVAGKVPAAKVTTMRSAQTLQGSAVRIRTAGGVVRIGGARVLVADVMASNGVIHVIDRVLIPSA